MVVDPSDVRRHDPERYRILGEHGRGGIGLVLRAHDVELGRDVALKQLISRGRLQEARFFREARITSRLEHPGIVPVYEAGRWPDGTPFYAMKLVSGRSLRALLDESGTLEQRISLLHHVIAVADAMAYAHGLGVIHRDLKPANIIIGDFGETVVIDWGLAKELSARADDATWMNIDHAGAIPDELTADGIVLGTRTYMPPEQERGEPVDARADVFAIGAMLWQLCALEKVPPLDSTHRRRILRRNNVDQDLAVILTKCLEVTPSQRYETAAALAADLKAFKAGSRISARTYSLPASVVHWARRHRTLAMSALISLSLIIAAVTFYIARITDERDRADAFNGQLVLEHARALLATDPTAARALLRVYHGEDRLSAQLLEAEALGRGVARVRAQPHSASVFLTEPLADGSLLTLSLDHTLHKQYENGAFRIVARNFTQPVSFAYQSDRALLAYTCDSGLLCVLNVLTEESQSLTGITPGFEATDLVFSRNGEHLAAVTSSGELRIWRMGVGTARLHYSANIYDGMWIVFAGDSKIIAADRDQIYTIDSLALAPVLTPLLKRSSISGAASDSGNIVVAGAEDGALLAIDVRRRLIMRTAAACPSPVLRVLTLSETRFAFACRGGAAGVWHIDRNTVDLLTGAVDAFILAFDGERTLYIGTTTGEILLAYLDTHTITRLRGHTGIVTALRPPKPGSPYIYSGDINGNIRVWPAPSMDVRLVAAAREPLTGLQWLADGTLIAVGRGNTLLSRAPNGEVSELTGHVAAHGNIVRTSRNSFALFGGDARLEIWTHDATDWRHQMVALGHGQITSAQAGDAVNQWIVASADGTLSSVSTDTSEVADISHVDDIPITLCRTPTNGLFIAGLAGRLWHLPIKRTATFNKVADVFRAIRCNGKHLVFGTNEQQIYLHDLDTGRLTRTFATQGHPKDIALSSDDRWLAISDQQRLSLYDLESNDQAFLAALPSERLVFTQDQRWLLAVQKAGDIWLYERTMKRWRYVSVGDTPIIDVQFSPDGRYLAIADSAARVLLLEM